MKDAWDNKRDVLVKSGTFAIEQLSEALSATASSNKLPEELPQIALRLCAEQVKLLLIAIWFLKIMLILIIIFLQETFDSFFVFF